MRKKDQILKISYVNIVTAENGFLIKDYNNASGNERRFVFKSMFDLLDFLKEHLQDNTTTIPTDLED